MPLDVTCPGCRTRFKVSEKFAGKEGPCPKCKAKILIPRLEDQVVVHAPEQFGPKGKGGAAVLKPIRRTETTVSTLTWVFSVGLVLAVLIGALLLRDPDRAQPWWLLGIGALVLAVPLCRAGYGFLRDDELQPFTGSELWIRVLICAVFYAATWAGIAWLPVAVGLESLQIYEVLGLAGIAIAFGTAVAHFALELEIGSSIVHYCFFLATTVLLRLMMGLALIPTEMAT